MAHIHLVEGPVGSGKSTYSNKLREQYSAAHLNLDQWMAMLFSPDRPSTDTMTWYLERKERCIEQIWYVACAILDAGSDVILELGLIQQHSREAFYKRVDDAGYDLTVYVLNELRDIRRERVRARNSEKGSTYSMDVPDHIFEIASDRWEEPDDVKCSKQKILFLPTEG